MKYALISTEKGDMKAELYENETPGTVANFAKLVSEGFYDSLSFHRVIPDFVVQGGCPDGTGAGGPGYTIKCETSAPRQYHEKGVLSMAHRGKDTGGSQSSSATTGRTPPTSTGYTRPSARLLKDSTFWTRFVRAISYSKLK